MHGYLQVLSILLQLQSYVPEYSEFSEENMKSHTKKIQLESSGIYYQKSTELSDTLEKTDEQIILNWEQPGEIIIFIYIQRIQRTCLCFMLY